MSLSPGASGGKDQRDRAESGASQRLLQHAVPAQLLGPGHAHGHGGGVGGGRERRGVEDRAALCRVCEVAGGPVLPATPPPASAAATAAIPAASAAADSVPAGRSTGCRCTEKRLWALLVITTRGTQPGSEKSHMQIKWTPETKGQRDFTAITQTSSICSVFKWTISCGPKAYLSGSKCQSTNGTYICAPTNKIW